MKIIVLTQYYPPEFGAAPVRLSDLVMRLVKQGHQVIVLTAMPNYPRGRIMPGYGGLFRREQRDGATILRTYIYPTKRAAMVPRLMNYFSFVVSSLVAGTLALPRADYLIVESPPLFLGISGYLLSRLKGARWIFNVSDLWPETAVRLGVVRQGLALRIAEALEVFCYRKAWLVSGQSREILATIGQRVPDVPTYHLSNGVDSHLFNPQLRSLELRRALADERACVAIYAGLFGLAQGLDQIIQAATRLRDLEALRFVLVGDGPEKEQLVDRARTLGLTNVHFLDPYPRDAMPALMASADIALVPLAFRLPGAVPSKLYEAMGAGLPVVLVAEGEAAEIVRETRCGVVVEPGNIDGLVDALRMLGEQKELRAEYGIKGRRAAMARFDRQRIADAFVDHVVSRAKSLSDG